MKRIHVVWMATVLLAAFAVGAGAIAQESSEEVGTENGGEQMLPDERRQEIDWRAAAEYRQLEAEAVPEPARKMYADSPVPVLLPDRAEALETIEPTVGANWYAARLEFEGREVTIEGDRVARVASDLELPEAGREQVGEKFHITQTHGVMTLTFTAFGAGYTVDIECANVDERGRCTDESFAVDVANRLAVLGGGR